MNIKDMIREMRETVKLHRQYNPRMDLGFVTRWADEMEKAMREPVAKVAVQMTGGNAGIAWYAAPVDPTLSLPPLADGTLLYALPPDAAGESWQPIETAPTKGRQMILLLTPSRYPQVAWSNTWWKSGFSVECKPTHWMPLPELPLRSAKS
jgi:hypothetical protein